MLTVSYFCIATEIRLMDNNVKNNEKILYNEKGEIWHARAVKFACYYLPSYCPLVKHYITSYSKHYFNNLSIIVRIEKFNNFKIIFYFFNSLKMK